jgi:beta-glucosidase
MGHQDSKTGGLRGMFGLLAFGVPVAMSLLAAISCGHLRAEVDTTGTDNESASSYTPVMLTWTRTPNVTALDADAGDAGPVQKMACGDSTELLPFTTDGGLDISSAKGYVADPTIKPQAQQIVSTMTKAQLANQMRGTPPQGGTNFNDIYRTADDPTAMVKGLQMRDGPRGVSLQQPQFSGLSQNASPIAYGKGYSTTFPVSMARGATFDLDMENRIGEDVADEMLTTGNTMILAPCVNILRHPAWGRAQETYGEDSFLLGRMGSAYVTGVQEYIPACVKHFAGNNIEDGRANQDAKMDDQTLHEIYGRHFDMIVNDAKVACVMAAYNQVNEKKSTLNGPLLIDMLRGALGFNGFVLSDFWAMPPYQAIQTQAQQAALAVQGLAASLDMELPWTLNYSQLESVATMDQLVTAATRIMEQKLRFKIATPGVSTATLGLKAPTSTLGTNGVDNTSHLADAELAATEAMVLLKNDANTLPIDKSKVHTIAVVGASLPWHLSGTNQSGTDQLATNIRIGDLGSSRVLSDPAYTIGPALGIQTAAGSGITVVSGNSASVAQDADFVVVMTGLTQQDEGEEYTGAGDRTDNKGKPNFNLDAKANTGVQTALVNSVIALKKPMVVVNESGAPIDMPWLDQVPAFVQAWYPGARGGVALGRLLFGDANFSGKLPVSWPKSEDDLPPFNQGGTSGGTTTMDYYLGYRYFDLKKDTIKPLFFFGAGLSYTTWNYAALNVPCSTVTKHGVVDVSFQLTNTGSVPGNEVAFLFVSFPSTQAPRRSIKELKGFIRTSTIMPGETVVATIPLRVQDLKYWNTVSSPAGWTVESGPVQIMVGPSSDNLPLMDTMTVQ